ncbi:MAG: beta-lactamase family protein [Ruminococcus sp.]|nr:beta-lactamase family protein [Ruminococcus sp.]
MKFKKAVCVFLALASIASAFAGCTAENAEIYDIKSVKVSSAKRSEIEKNVNETLEYNEFCGSAAISMNEAEVYNKAYGYADAIKEKKLSTKSCYQINVLTKTFTGIAILMLEKSGKIKLSDTLNKYFTSHGNHRYISKIKISDLLTNKISLGSYYDEIVSNQEEYLNYYKFLDSDDPDKYGVQISNMIINHIFNHGVDEKSDSTMSNYYVLGKIVTLSSGTSYREYIQNNIFKPLGMKDSGFVSSKYNFSGLNMDNKVWHRQGERPEYSSYGFMYAALGIVSSSRDMAKFYIGLLNGKIGDIDVVKELRLAPSREYLGFEIDGNNAYCTGRTALHCAYVHINMGNMEAVTLLSNCVGKSDINEMGNELYEIISSKINGIILSDIKNS